MFIFKKHCLLSILIVPFVANIFLFSTELLKNDMDGAICSVSSSFKDPEQAIFNSESWLKDEIKKHSVIGNKENEGWVLVDQAAMAVGNTVLCISDFEEFLEVEKCFQSDLLNTPFSVKLNFGTLISLYLKSLEMGGKTNGNFKKILEYFEDTLGIPSTEKSFSSELLKKQNFSLKNLEQYFLYKEAAIGILNHYNSLITKLLNNQKKLNLVTSSPQSLFTETYDFGVMFLTKDDLDLYDKGLLVLELIMFENKEIVDIDKEIFEALKTLKEGEISTPIKFEDENKYFILKYEKKNSSNIVNKLTEKDFNDGIKLLLLNLKSAAVFTIFPTIK